MLLVYVLFFLYFLVLCLFSLFSHPVCYCILLVVNALLSGSLCYINFGFGWYPLLFFLVYIGGVYVLFIFVSVYSPNSNCLVYFNIGWFSGFMISFVVAIIGIIIVRGVLEIEFSHFLCSSQEGVFYVVICLMLIFGFLILSLLMSIKTNHYR
uniref:NADH dehydrogenase subunit 6 n=1 Tax=Moniezia benedeni TaxID=218196 RepID=A0A7R6SZL8_9CEST|nr:NADH dehydrogenase subunit 6 [Moniezia benedeni]